MLNTSLLNDFCNLARMISERDNKTWGQAIEEITESLKEDNRGSIYDK